MALQVDEEIRVTSAPVPMLNLTSFSLTLRLTSHGSLGCVSCVPSAAMNALGVFSVVSIPLTFTDDLQTFWYSPHFFLCRQTSFLLA